MFNPTRAQSRAKAQLKATTKDNPLLGDLASLPVSKLKELCGASAVEKWVKDSDFCEWFFNMNYSDQTLQGAVDLAIREAYYILEAPADGEKGSPKHSDKIAAMKLILEYAGYGKKAKDDKKAEDELDNMTKEELDELIQKGLKTQNITAIGS